MARMRSVKPEFWADEDLAEQVSRDARLLYIGLWNLADEHGRLRGDPRYIKGQIFPYDDDLAANDIDLLLKALAEAGKVVRYQSGGGRYLYLPNLSKHQRLESDKVPSRLPTPPARDGSEPDETPRANLSARNPDESEPGADELSLSFLSMEHVAGGMEQGGVSTPGADKPRTNRASRIPDGFPDDPARTWAAEHAPSVNLLREVDRFRDYWLAIPGAKGTKTDWAATWRNWVRRAEDDRRPTTRASPNTNGYTGPYRDDPNADFHGAL